MGPYLRAIRSHKLLVALSVLAAVAGSVAWLSERSPIYEATAQVLVTPISTSDPGLIGIDVIRESPGDQTRTIQTAATLVESDEAASRTALALDNGWTSEGVLDAITVQPQGESDILAVTAEADSSRLAAELANEFALSALFLRTRTLQRQAAAQIPRLRARRRRLPSLSPEAGELATRLDQLESLRSGDDPSLSLSQQARQPSSASGVGTPLILVLAALAGFSVGSGAALFRELLERRIRDEYEAVALWPLPVLARVPIVKQRKLRRPSDSRWIMPPPIREAFRTLLIQLGQGGEGRVVMVTSASAGDGKTTAAVNLAASISAAGDSVILLDLDLRKPALSRVLNIPEPTTGLASRLESEVALTDLLVSAPALPPVSVLSTTAAKEDVQVVEAVNRRLPALIEEGRRTADWIVIDTAPLGEVSDALQIAQHVDTILIVTRVAHTNRSDFEIMRELLERTPDADPTGLLVVGGAERMSTYYGYDPGKASKRRGPLSRTQSD